HPQQEKAQSQLPEGEQHQQPLGPEPAAEGRFQAVGHPAQPLLPGAGHQPPEGGAQGGAACAGKIGGQEGGKEKEGGGGEGGGQAGGPLRQSLGEPAGQGGPLAGQGLQPLPGGVLEG